MKYILPIILLVALAGCKDEQVSTTTDFNRMVENTVIVQMDSGHGSGFVVLGHPDLVVTCQHVAVALTDEGCPRVVDFRGIEHGIASVSMSSTNDIAILRLKDSIPVSGVSLGTISLGERVYACGTPFSEQLAGSISSGVMSGVRFDSPDPIVYQFDVPINSGNSGGPIFNTKG